MYYNKIAGRWILDAVDYFLISSFIASSLTSYLKNYWSEKVSMARLKNDIIKKSRFIERSKATKSLNNFNSKESKIQKIYRFALDNRGGCNYEYQLADQIQDLVIKLAVFLKKKERKAKALKIIFTHGRLVLQLVLSLCKINLQYVVVDPVNATSHCHCMLYRWYNGFCLFVVFSGSYFSCSSNTIISFLSAKFDPTNSA